MSKRITRRTRRGPRIWKRSTRYSDEQIKFILRRTLPPTGVKHGTRGRLYKDAAKAFDEAFYPEHLRGAGFVPMKPTGVKYITDNYGEHKKFGMPKAYVPKASSKGLKGKKKARKDDGIPEGAVPCPHCLGTGYLEANDAEEEYDSVESYEESYYIESENEDENEDGNPATTSTTTQQVLETQGLHPQEDSQPPGRCPFSAPIGATVDVLSNNTNASQLGFEPVPQFHPRVNFTPSGTSSHDLHSGHGGGMQWTGGQSSGNPSMGYPVSGSSTDNQTFGFPMGQMNQPPRYVGLPNIWAGMSPGMVRRMLPQYGNMNHGATPAAHGSGYPPPQPTGFQGTSSQANMPPFEMRQAPATQLTAPAQLQLAQPSYNPAPSPYGLAAMPPQALVYRQSRTPESRTPTTRKRTRGQLEEEPDEDEAAKRPKTAGSGSHTNQGYASAASDQNQNQNQNQESLFAPPTAAATAVGANPSAAIPGPATGLANPSTTTTSHHTTMVNPSPAIPGLSTATTVPTVPTATAEASGSVPAPVGFSDTWDIDFTDIPDFMGPFDFSVYPELPDDQNANNNNGA